MRAQVVDWFQDMHLVWAGLGASVATLICVVGSASVLHAANQERPNSMARVISVLASPGSNDNPMRLNYEMMCAARRHRCRRSRCRKRTPSTRCRRWCRAKAACRASR